MVWAVMVIVVAAVSVPSAAWGVARRWERGRQVPADGLGPPADAVDSWLIGQYRLPAPQRWQARDAVVYGRAVGDPALRQAAHDLAGCVLRGELRLGRSIRIGGIVLLAEGVALMAMGIAILIAASSPGGVAPVLLGAWLLAQGVVTLSRTWRGARRAYQLNT
jgi:hypothetical protein